MNKSQQHKPNIAIIFGGRSGEYGVSLQSATAVIKAIDTNKYQPILIGITRAGEWFRFNGDTDKIADDTWYNDNDCVHACILPCSTIHGMLDLDNHSPLRLDAAMPVMHGKYGEDGTVQGLLELAGIPIIGCTTMSSALCMDKVRSHSVVSAAGIDIPWGVVIDSPADIAAALDQAAALRYPLFVKPVRAGSSLGVSCVRSQIELSQAVERAFKIDDQVIIEEMVEGFEVGCAIMGKGNDSIIGEVDEIELTGDFFDFTEKYTLETAQIHLPARLSEQTTAKVKQTALRIYKALGCSGFARVDMFITPDEQIVFNEVNTIPGFTSHSRYPRMMEAIGYSFATLINHLIEMGVKQEC